MYEEIISEIERRSERCLSIADDPRNRESRDYYLGKTAAYMEAIPLLKSAKPSEDLDELVKAELPPMADDENLGLCCCDQFGNHRMSVSDAKELARHFYELGKKAQSEQMMKDAVDGKIVSCPARNDIEMQTDEFSNATANFKDGQKVKVIIVKEDSK